MKGGVTACSRVLAALCLASTLRRGLTRGAVKISECPADAPDPTYRWVNSGTQLYVEGTGACVTLSDIYNNFEDAPLVPMTEIGDEVDEETG